MNIIKVYDTFSFLHRLPVPTVICEFPQILPWLRNSPSWPPHNHQWHFAGAIIYICQISCNGQHHCLILQYMHLLIYLLFAYFLLQGAGHVHDIYPNFLKHAQKTFPHLICMDDLYKISDLSNPPNWCVPSPLSCICWWEDYCKP